MKIKLGASGTDAIALKLRNASERVSDRARKVMHRKADQIVELAKLQAPVDKHNLEDSIEKRVTYGLRGRLQVDITVGGIVRGVDVSQYAVQIHENYNQMQMGEGTKQKQKDNPQVVVGRKFLSRAVEFHREALKQEMIQDVLKVWKL
ncbi:MAG: HK97 gp10 family phage protein [Roseibium sp.]|nr:HK97 gp10 family phage protein [Roseibium sp.]